MTQKVQVTSSYHDEILKGHLVVLLCHGCDMFLIVFFCFGGSAQESWPWCGIPCGLGHCEGLSGGNQQLPCKAAKFASIGQLAQLRCLRKIFDRLAADPEKMGLKTRFHLKLAFVEALVFGMLVPTQKTIEHFRRIDQGDYLSEEYPTVGRLGDSV